MFFSVSVVIMETKKKFRPYPNLKLMDQSIKGLSLPLTHCPQKGSRADLPPFLLVKKARMQLSKQAL
jgi:hypothetical protein